MGRFVKNHLGQDVYVPSPGERGHYDFWYKTKKVNPLNTVFSPVHPEDLAAPIPGMGVVPDIEREQPVIYDRENLQFDNLMLTEEENEQMRQMERDRREREKERERQLKESQEYKNWDAAMDRWMATVKEYKRNLANWERQGGTKEEFVQQFGYEPSQKDAGIPERPRVAQEGRPFMGVQPRRPQDTAVGRVVEQNRAQEQQRIGQEADSRVHKENEKYRQNRSRKDAMLNSPEAREMVSKIQQGLADEEDFKANWVKDKTHAWDVSIEGDAYQELWARENHNRIVDREASKFSGESTDVVSEGVSGTSRYPAGDTETADETVEQLRQEHDQREFQKELARESQPLFYDPFNQFKDTSIQKLSKDIYAPKEFDPHSRKSRKATIERVQVNGMAKQIQRRVVEIQQSIREISDAEMAEADLMQEHGPMFVDRDAPERGDLENLLNQQTRELVKLKEKVFEVHLKDENISDRNKQSFVAMLAIAEKQIQKADIEHRYEIRLNKKLDILSQEDYWKNLERRKGKSFSKEERLQYLRETETPMQLYLEEQTQKNVDKFRQANALKSIQEGIVKAIELSGTDPLGMSRFASDTGMQILIGISDGLAGILKTPVALGAVVGVPGASTLSNDISSVLQANAEAVDVYTKRTLGDGHSLKTLGLTPSQFRGMVTSIYQSMTLGSFGLQTKGMGLGFGLTTFADEYQNAMDVGLTKGTAMFYAAIQGTAEGLFEAALPGTNKWVTHFIKKNTLKKTASDSIKIVMPTFKSRVKDAFKMFGEEQLSEALTTIVQLYAEGSFIHEDKNFFSENIGPALLEMSETVFAQTLLMGGGGNLMSGRGRRLKHKYNERMRRYQERLDRMYGKLAPLTGQIRTSGSLSDRMAEVINRISPAGAAQLRKLREQGKQISRTAIEKLYGPEIAGRLTKLEQREAFADAILGQKQRVQQEVAANSPVLQESPTKVVEVEDQQTGEKNVVTVNVEQGQTAQEAVDAQVRTATGEAPVVTAEPDTESLSIRDPESIMEEIKDLKDSIINPETTPAERETFEKRKKVLEQALNKRLRDRKKETPEAEAPAEAPAEGEQSTVDTSFVDDPEGSLTMLIPAEKRSRWKRVAAKIASITRGLIIRPGNRQSGMSVSGDGSLTVQAGFDQAIDLRGGEDVALVPIVSEEVAHHAAAVSNENHSEIYQGLWSRLSKSVQAVVETAYFHSASKSKSFFDHIRDQYAQQRMMDKVTGRGSESSLSRKQAAAHVAGSEIFRMLMQRRMGITITESLKRTDETDAEYEQRQGKLNEALDAVEESLTSEENAAIDAAIGEFSTFMDIPGQAEAAPTQAPTEVSPEVAPETAPVNTAETKALNQAEIDLEGLEEAKKNLDLWNKLNKEQDSSFTPKEDIFSPQIEKLKKQIAIAKKRQAAIGPAQPTPEPVPQPTPKPSPKPEYDENGFDQEGYDSSSFDIEGFSRSGVDKYGVTKDGRITTPEWEHWNPLDRPDYYDPDALGQYFQAKTRTLEQAEIDLKELEDAKKRDDIYNEKLKKRGAENLIKENNWPLFIKKLKKQIAIAKQRRGDVAEAPTEATPAEKQQQKVDAAKQELKDALADVVRNPKLLSGAPISDQEIRAAKAVFNYLYERAKQLGISAKEAAKELYKDFNKKRGEDSWFDKVVSSKILEVDRRLKQESAKEPPVDDTDVINEEDRNGFELAEETLLQKLRRLWQDEMGRLFTTQKAIEDVKGPIPDSLNAYLKAELYVGRAGDKIDKFTKATKEFFQRMNAAGITDDQLGDYLYALHVKERNARLKEQRDVDNGSGRTDEWAQDIIDNATPEMKKFAEQFRKGVIEKRLKLLYESGLIDKEAYDLLSSGDVYKFYVPLKHSTKPKRGRGFSLVGRDVQRAKGRSTVANNPLHEALADYTDTLIRIEKNRVAKTLLALVEENPDKDVWEAQSQRYKPVFDQDGNLQYMNPDRLEDNQIVVKVDGKSKIITIHDESLSRFFNKMGTGRGIPFLGAAMSFWRMTTTTYDPEFTIIANPARDIQFALAALTIEQKRAAAKKTLKYLPKALHGIWHNVRDSKDNEWSRWYSRFKKAGAKVTWLDHMTTEEKTAKYKSQIRNMNNPSNIRRGLEATKNFFDDMSESFESAVRLAAFRTYIEAGVSEEKAAQAAKNLTVNFNKKGEYGTYLNSLYLFAGAGIQGSTRMLSLLKTQRGRNFMIGFMGVGFIQSLINRMIGDDEEEEINHYEKIPQHIRDSHWIFMIPGGKGKYVKINMPYGLNVPIVAGKLLEETTRGETPVHEAVGRFAGAVSDGFNPLGTGSVMQFLSPTITDPIVQIAENKTFFGGPLKPEQDQYQGAIPESELYFDSVRPMSKATTQWFNRMTGGSDEVSGFVDISPEMLDYLIDFMGKGSGRFMSNVAATTTSLAQAKVPDMKHVPFVRKVVDKPNVQASKSIVYPMFENRNRVIYSDEQIQRYRKHLREIFAKKEISEKTYKRMRDDMTKGQSSAKKSMK